MSAEEAARARRRLRPGMEGSGVRVAIYAVSVWVYLERAISRRRRVVVRRRVEARHGHVASVEFAIRI